MAPAPSVNRSEISGAEAVKGHLRKASYPLLWPPQEVL
jgi:hypothetical protein